jgi:7-cyano-7-deazaguanine synthase in queuosine biosynthesis
LLYVDLGTKYSEIEKVRLSILVSYLGIEKPLIEVPLSFVKDFEKGNGEVPYRNLLLITVAKMFGDEVVLSVEEGTQVNESNDRSDAFFNKVNDIFSYLDGYNSTIINPVRELTKIDEVKAILSYFGKKEGEKVLRMTFSCYSPVSGRECGNCPACIRKFLALEYNHIEAAGLFGSNPLKSKVLKTYIKETKAGKYTGARGEQYKEVFKRLKLVG